MKINSVNNLNNRQNFKGGVMEKIAKHPGLVATLAGSSVLAQKIVMSSAEATVAPAMDIAVGKAITKVTNEKDGKTQENSKTQAIRTFSQAVGGTIVGVIIRGICIAGATMLLSKAGEKAGRKIADLINPEKLSVKANNYEYAEKMASWGKSVGGAVALGVMLVTNFIIDAPFINKINKKTTDLINKISKKEDKSPENVQKEVK